MPCAGSSIRAVEVEVRVRRAGAEVLQVEGSIGRGPWGDSARFLCMLVGLPCRKDLSL